MKKLDPSFKSWLDLHAPTKSPVKRTHDERVRLVHIVIRIRDWTRTHVLCSVFSGKTHGETVKFCQPTADKCQAVTFCISTHRDTIFVNKLNSLADGHWHWLLMMAKNASDWWSCRRWLTQCSQVATMFCQLLAPHAQCKACFEEISYESIENIFT